MTTSFPSYLRLITHFNEVKGGMLKIQQKLSDKDFSEGYLKVGSIDFVYPKVLVDEFTDKVMVTGEVVALVGGHLVTIYGVIFSLRKEEEEKLNERKSDLSQRLNYIISDLSKKM